MGSGAGMQGMTKGEIDLLVYKYLGVDGGYLCWFSYSAHDSFYAEYCDLEVDVPAMRKAHGTTRNTFIAILQLATPGDQARIIRGVLDKVPVENFTTDVQKKSAVAERLQAIAARLEGIIVPGTPPRATTETVHQALRDAEELLKTQGPRSAVDRVHTALHGHVRYLCDQAEITVANSDPDATLLLKALVDHHPRLQIPEPRRQDIRTILRSASAIIGAIGTIRNRASVAHANELLLDNEEALLVINAARTLMLYVDRKLGATN
ncbi:MAG: abortive infection family protein [Labilithrix sp.]|nr:abortive infection family protein [Labilithrix sp.]